MPTHFITSLLVRGQQTSGGDASGNDSCSGSVGVGSTNPLLKRRFSLKVAVSVAVVVALIILPNHICHARPCHQFTPTQQMALRQELHTTLFQDYIKAVKPISIKSEQPSAAATSPPTSVNDSNTATNGTSYSLAYYSLPVSVDMSIISVSQLDTLKGTFELNTWFRIWWADFRLSWNPQDYCDELTQIVLPSPQELIWLPDISFWLLRDDPIRTSYSETPATIFHNGTIRWSRGRQDQIHCELDLHSFPQDVQVCNFTVGSWAHTAQEIITLPFGYNGDSTTTDDRDAPIFQIDKTRRDIIPGADLSSFKQRDTHKVKEIIVTATRVQYFSNQPPWTQVDYSFKIAREPFTYINTVAWPLVIVTVIAVLTPLYHPTAPGKSTLAVTLLLTLSAIYITASTWVPKLNYPTALSELYRTCLLFSLTAVLEAGASVYLVTMVRESKHKNLQWNVPIITWILDKTFWHVKIRGIIWRRRIQEKIRKVRKEKPKGGTGRKDMATETETSNGNTTTVTLGSNGTTLSNPNRSTSRLPLAIDEEELEESRTAWQFSDSEREQRRQQEAETTTTKLVHTKYNNNSLQVANSNNYGKEEEEEEEEEEDDGNKHDKRIINNSDLNQQNTIDSTCSALDDSERGNSDNNRSNFHLVRSANDLERKARERCHSTQKMLSYKKALMTGNQGIRPNESTIEKLIQLYLGDTSVEIPKSDILQCKNNFILECAIVLDQLMSLVLPISFAIYIGMFSNRYNIDWFAEKTYFEEGDSPILQFVAS